MKVLLTGFDAFGGAAVNPSWLTVQALDGRSVAGHKIIAAQLPTAFETSIVELSRLLRAYKPALVICVGQAGGRDSISIERVAINIQDASIADNVGHQPLDLPVINGGPAAYFSTLPIKAMLHSLKVAGIRAEISQTAGTFVCNHVFYALMHALASSRRAKKPRGGFVHVPFLPVQNALNMGLETMVADLYCAVESALTTEQSDLTYGSG